MEDSGKTEARSSWTVCVPICYSIILTGSKGFLKTLSTFTGDLSQLTAPSFILSGTSLLEYSAYWAEHPNLFAQAAKESDEERRALAVLKWFLATLKGQFAARNETSGRMFSEKKPLNPVLGEIFHGSWAAHGDVGETVLLAEQVSHHPPIAAYKIQNKKAGVIYRGFNGQKSGFTGRTISVKQVGHGIYHLDQQKEDYLITFPNLRLEGLLFMAPYVELSGSSYIVSSTGYVATIDYSGRGWLSGIKNSFTATLSKESGGLKGATLHTISGVWTGSSKIRNEMTKKETPFWDSSTNAPRHLNVEPLLKQERYNSRLLWEKVAKALAAGDFDLAGKEKSEIENWQRNLRKEERGRNEPWVQRYFEWVELEPISSKLSKFLPAKNSEESSFSNAWIPK
ncbi:Protein kes1 [Neolecta irregularis DAH-3]|uniref:Protein kes1 n=1 Tax=Neolecta irregularis (strain DAH-3) TaxID=1198029 RepID=A0A1U7LUF7_NEOID|nr:Protein kes1 [Neolecta irregularis DAH-3]|eukprot:OLL26259.1 Protein kes1 [Neolecta irregularis DAH-3]